MTYHTKDFSVSKSDDRFFARNPISDEEMDEIYEKLKNAKLIPTDITPWTYEENYGHQQTGSKRSTSAESPPSSTRGTGVQHTTQDVPGSSLSVAEESRGDDS